MKIVDLIHSAPDRNQIEQFLLPKIVLRLQELLSSPAVTVEGVVHLVQSDPAMAVFIVEAWNRSSLSRLQPAFSLKSAVARMGLRLFRNLVFAYVFQRLFKAETQFVGSKLDSAWRQSCEVAANAYVLASRCADLYPEDAMLVGLLLNVGILPIYMEAQKGAQVLDLATLERTERQTSASIGAEILRGCGIRSDLIDAAIACRDPHRILDTDLPDYTDVLTVARLQASGTVKFIEWKNIDSAERLGLSPSACRDFQESHRKRLNAIRILFRDFH